MNKITRIPISGFQRYKNRLGKMAVACQVSGRWLQFHPHSSDLRGGEFITLDVMTENTDDERRKLCQLIVTREDLQRVLSLIKPR